MKAADTVRLKIPKQRVAADLQGLIGHMAKAALNGVVVQNWPAAIADLVNALGTVSIKHTEGELAWQLLLTGIGEAITELANDTPPNKISPEALRTIIKRVADEAEDADVPIDFITDPHNLSPVTLAKRCLLECLATHEISIDEQYMVSLHHRFDSALTLGLCRAIRNNEQQLRPLLALRENPTNESWQILEDWRHYRAWLESQFRTAPVFEENFALDRLFVPLNAWRISNHQDIEKAESEEVREVVRLNDDLFQWLSGRTLGDRLRLISGGPGSGKSSAMKALADELTRKGIRGERVDVLFFPLQHFIWRSGIVESVGRL